MSQLIPDFVSERRWAVVGVSDDKYKFGRRIFESLRQAGYDVVPVHHQLKQLDDGTPVYASVKDIPEPVAVVDLVVPPAATLGVLRDCVEAGVKKVWFQPGTENPESFRLAEENGIAIIADGSCAMVEKKRW
jgi:hypothetical protein